MITSQIVFHILLPGCEKLTLTLANKEVFHMVEVIISSTICSLIITISNLEELIRPHVAWLCKLRFWSFKVINGSLLTSFSMLSSNLLA